MLKRLKVQGLPPLDNIEIEPGSRLNIITGDNGLGKTFLLEVMWLGITGECFERKPVLPLYKSNGRRVFIDAEFSIKSELFSYKTLLDSASAKWKCQKELYEHPFSRLLMMSRADGTVGTWDSIIPPGTLPGEWVLGVSPLGSHGPSVYLNAEQVLNGKWMGSRDDPDYICDGLINDIKNWELRYKDFYKKLNEYIERIGSFEDPRLQLGELRDDIPHEKRLMPTIKHHYGEVPIIWESEGIKRILSWAYALLWLELEAKKERQVEKLEDIDSFYIFIDEIECHLHPKWQRTILPSLLEIAKDLPGNPNVQFFVTTHSPIVLNSIDTMFNEETDKLFHFTHDKENPRKVALDEMMFDRKGSVSNWLTSDSFDSQPLRNQRAVETIEKAKALQKQADPDSKEVQRVHEELSKTLGQNDSFWPRWTYFAEKHGVEP